MIKNWKTRVEYYNVKDGLRITPRKAKLYFKILKKTKSYDYRESHRAPDGHYYGTAYIVWTCECEANRQLTIKFGKQQATNG